MIDGIWWLVIIFSVIAALWLVAHLRGAKLLPNKRTNNKQGKQSVSSQQPVNEPLQKTLKLIKKHFPKYQVSRRANHLLISHQGKKIAMITIDSKLATGRRLLGEVPVINYHRAPNRDVLAVNLQETE